MTVDTPSDRVLVYARVKPQSKDTALQAASASKTHPSQIAVRPADENSSSPSCADEDVEAKTKKKPTTTRKMKKTVTIENPLAGTGDVRSFKLDGVFGPDSTQGEVYDALGAPVLNDVLAGCRGCVLAYGEANRSFRVVPRPDPPITLHTCTCVTRSTKKAT